MKFDYSKLIGRIIEKFGSRRAFAKACGFSENTISKKLSGKMAITTDDIINWSSADLLDIDSSEIPEYFFAIKVQVS
jgi:transcriptional regulator with XRE-family HTH domain